MSPARKRAAASPPSWARRAVANGEAADAFVADLMAAVERGWRTGEDQDRTRAEFAARLTLILERAARGAG